ncbi:MAG TPA: histidine kinase [Actinophytocola sp.]|uniref:sensor histidine kinase n=1 Tax=Actinophytocola sp. TaxID=1872138 RepID=UPI002DB561B2|nr:histidine kinase [Actinophytocola sp.]HEU5470367.1 histidine kinase [Actinophytocola sp.]
MTEGQGDDVREMIDRAVFEERDRIARDLHDLVIQRLFAIGLGIKALGYQMSGPLAEDRLPAFVADIDQTIRDIRRSIFLLQQRPNSAPSLRGEVLRAISEATASLGYEPTVQLEGPLDSVVPPEVHLDLIATLREALSNVIRHANARTVSVMVTVDRAARRLELIVTDDGRGLPRGPTRRSGLVNIAQRAIRLRGTCHVSAPAGGGTRVWWGVPLDRTSEAIESGAEPLEATP